MLTSGFKNYEWCLVNSIPVRTCTSLKISVSFLSHPEPQLIPWERLPTLCTPSITYGQQFLGHKDLTEGLSHYEIQLPSVLQWGQVKMTLLTLSVIWYHEQDKVFERKWRSYLYKLLTYPLAGLIILPTELMDYLDSVKVWSLDRNTNIIWELLEVQNLRPFPRPAESETLGARSRNLHFNQPPGDPGLRTIGQDSDSLQVLKMPGSSWLNPRLSKSACWLQWDPERQHWCPRGHHGP